ncbi:MAG: GFA family protein [Paracoccaceae bacterium]|nr:GFA family protein [Paracoccaceae bacterium]
MSGIAGRCLCGKVTIRLTGCRREVSACHCAMCRRWSGAATWGFEAAAADVRIEGRVKSYRSSPFAERAFCPECGTHLWIRDDGKAYEFTPGLFDDASGFLLSREVYADRAFACVRLEGSHERVTRADYERSHLFVEGDGT